jgi:hypothetical protein
MSNSGADTSGGPDDTTADGTGTDTGSQGIACINDRHRVHQRSVRQR